MSAIDPANFAAKEGDSPAQIAATLLALPYYERPALLRDAQGKISILPQEMETVTFEMMLKERIGAPTLRELFPSAPAVKNTLLDESKVALEKLFNALTDVKNGNIGEAQKRVLSQSAQIIDAIMADVSKSRRRTLEQIAQFQQLGDTDANLRHEAIETESRNAMMFETQYNSLQRAAVLHGALLNALGVSPPAAGR